MAGRGWEGISKAEKGGGYTRWAKVFNVRQMAQALLFLQEKGIRDYDTLAERSSVASEREEKAKSPE